MNDMISRQTRLIDTNEENKRAFVFRKLKSVSNPNSIHGIYPYRGKISAIDAKQVIEQLPKKGSLLDPFCGSGTIIYEAQKWGLDSIGVDNNPIAITISRGKTQRIDIENTILHSRRIVDEAESIREHMEMPSSPEQYFHEKTAKEIMKLFSLKDTLSYFELAALYGSVCLTARACNNYTWSSNAVGKIAETKRYVNFYKVFLTKVKKHARFVDGGRKATIYEGDSRNLGKLIPTGSVDFVFTSPPYFDALDYTSYYARIIYEIENRDRATIRKGLIQKATSYENDMKIIMNEIGRVTRSGAIVIFVVGDKKLSNGTIVEGGKFFANLSDWKPESIVERVYSGTSSQIWDSINKTQRKEQIIIWKKS